MHRLNKIACCAIVMISPGLAIAKYHGLDSQADLKSKSLVYVTSHNREVPCRELPYAPMYKKHPDSWVTAEGKSTSERYVDVDSKGNPWKQLTPEQQRKIEERRKRYEALPASEKERIKKARQEYRALPPERRRELRDEWEKMNSEERRNKSKKIRDKKSNRQ